MDLHEAIYTTRAMRRLATTPIPDDVLPRLFDAAVRGPSSGNAQVIRFLTVSNPDTKAAVGEIYKRCLTELYAGKYSAAMDTLDSGAEDEKTKQANRVTKSAQHLGDHLHEAPVLVFVFGRELGETTTMPCIWNFCLAARAEGLGTTLTTMLKLHKAEVEALLGLDDPAWHMHAMLPVGYPTGNWGIAKRKPADESVFAEKWGQAVDWTVPEPLWSPDS